jgi:hypothetical protein
MKQDSKQIKITLPKLSLPDGTNADLHAEYQRLCQAFRKQFTNLTLRGRRAAAEHATATAQRMEVTHLTALAELIHALPLSTTEKTDLFQECRSEIHHLTKAQQVRRTIAHQRKAKKERERQHQLENSKSATLANGGAEVTREFIKRTVTFQLSKQQKKKTNAKQNTQSTKNKNKRGKTKHSNKSTAPNGSSGRPSQDRSHSNTHRNNRDNNTNRNTSNNTNRNTRNNTTRNNKKQRKKNQKNQKSRSRK